MADKKTQIDGFDGLKRCLRLILQTNRGFVGLILFFGLLTSALSLAVPISVQALVNTLAFTALHQPLVVLSILLFIVLLAAGVFQLLQLGLIDLFHRRIFAVLGSEVSTRLFLAKTIFYERRNAVELVNRFFDVFTLQKSIATLLTDGFSLALQLIVGLGLIALYHPFLLLFDIFLLTGLALVWIIFVRRGVISAILESKAKYAFVNWLEEQGRGYRLLSSTNAESMVLSRSESLIENYVERRRKHFRVLIWQVGALVGLHAVSSALLLGLGGYLVVQNQLSLGQLVAAEIIVTGILVKLARAGKYLEMFYDLTAAAEKVMHLFDFEIGTSKTDAHNLDPLRISVQGLTARDKQRSFELSMDIQPKERIFFSVKHAACKDIFLDALMGQFQGQCKGEVFFNGVEVRLLPSQALRSSVYLVGQPTIIEGRLRDNLTLGRSSITDEEIYAVLELVDLRNQIAELSEGLDTVILPTGEPFWQSQLVRFDLARALLQGPQVIILSEMFQVMGKPRRDRVLSYLMSEDRRSALLHFGSKPSSANDQIYDRVMDLGWKDDA